MKTNIYLRPVSRLFICALLFGLCVSNAHAQNTFPSTGRAGIYTISPVTSLQVKGGARIGTTANYVNIDSATGKLTFAGTGVYQVAGNKYAFQYTANPNFGLFFNSTSTQYEFRNGSAVPVFSINANTGNSVFNGTLKVGAYTLPATDGTNGQVLKTNGTGALTWGADNNTTYSAGTGLSLSGTTFTNTAPDKTVALTAGTGISVTGTYPNFTITNTGSSGGGWSLTGNAGTDSSINFIGTTDAHPLEFRVNNKKAGYIDHDASKANTAFGYKSLFSNTGIKNTAIGYSALSSNTSGYQNTAIGDSVLYANTTGFDNSAYGSYSMYANTTGQGNTAVGYSTLINNTTGNLNIAVGNGSLYQNKTGSYNTATGVNVLESNVNGSYNTGSGLNALQNNIDGINNTATGAAALQNNTNGTNNSAHGMYALYLNTTGQQNTANGYASLYSNDVGSYNSAHGTAALNSNVNGSYNTANGAYTLYLNSSGSNNTASGYQALYQNTVGLNNTANGVAALQGNIDGNENTAVGTYAFAKPTDGIDNTAVGYSAMYGANSGDFVFRSTAIGAYALYNMNANDLVPPENNTGVGFQSLYHTTYGPDNTGVGYNALYSNYDGSANTAIGSGADVNASSLTNATALGDYAIATANNQVMLGNTSVTSVKAAGSFVIYSDGRFKKNIQENTHGLDFINELKPVTYNYDIHKLNAFIAPQTNKKDSLSAKEKDRIEEGIQNKEKILYSGFVAQDVETAAKKIGYDFSGIHKPQNDKDPYGLSYSDFVVPLVKAVQELSSMNDAKDAKIDTLQNQLNELRTLVLSIQQQQQSCSPCNAGLNQSSSTQSYAIIADVASLEQNIPNPFSSTTLIKYSLPQKYSSAYILITDKNGRSLKQINVSGSGKGNLTVEASTLSSGAYQYSLIIDGKMIATKQMVLAK